MGTHLKALLFALLALPVFAFDAMDFDEDWSLATQFTDVLEGLVAWWKLDGNANDSAGANNGVVSGATVTDGKINLAYSFDGARDYIEVADASAVKLSGDFTISMWLKTTTTDNLVVFETDRNSGYSVQTFNHYIAITIGSKQLNTSTKFDPSDNLWNHVVFVIADVPKVYANGTAVVSGLSALTPNYSSGPLYFGGRGPNFTFNGSIDDVRIYNRALSSNEVAQIYNLYK